MKHLSLKSKCLHLIAVCNGYNLSWKKNLVPTNYNDATGNYFKLCKHISRNVTENIVQLRLYVLMQITKKKQQIIF